MGRIGYTSDPAFFVKRKAEPKAEGRCTHSDKLTPDDYDCLMLDAYWTKRFGDSPPIAHLLRDLYRRQWVRFHSLPDSKRYPESDVEWKTVLNRHHAILSALTPEGSSLDLLTTNWSVTPDPAGPAKEVLALQIPAVAWRTVVEHEVEGDPEPCYWHVFRSSVTWPSSTIAAVIPLVAADEISNVMILDPLDSWLLHPYDGGMDVILGSTERRDEFASRYCEWRPVNGDL